MRIGKISKKTAATLGNRLGMTPLESSLVTDLIYHLVNGPRAKAHDILVRVIPRKYKNIEAEQRLRLLDFADYVADNHAPLLLGSLNKPMDFEKVARRLFRGKVDFTCVGWDVYWYLQLLFRSDGTVDCYVQASSILASRYVASVTKEDWMKDGMIPYLFYTPAHEGETTGFPGGRMKFVEGFTQSYLEAVNDV